MGLGCENMTKIWENGVGCSRFFEKNERGRGREGEVGETRNPRGGGVGWNLLKVVMGIIRGKKRVRFKFGFSGEKLVFIF